jgi:hypothetical protein
VIPNHTHDPHFSILLHADLSIMQYVSKDNVKPVRNMFVHGLELHKQVNRKQRMSMTVASNVRGKTTAQ